MESESHPEQVDKADARGAGGEDDDAPENDEPRPQPSRRLLWFLVVPMIGMVVLAQVGDALAPTLVDTRPLLLIAMNARSRNLVLVVNQIDPFWFFLVATIRLVASDPLFYLLGYFYGDSAVGWMERRSPRVGRWARDSEGLFRKASYPLVFIAPNLWICLLAGSARMRPLVFITLNFTGTIARLLLIVWLGETFAEPIDWVLDFIKTWRWYLVALSVAMVAVTLLREVRKGTGEVAQLRQLGKDIESGKLDDELDAESAEDGESTGHGESQ